MKVNIGLALIMLAGCTGPKTETRPTVAGKPTPIVVETPVMKGHRTPTAKQETLLREFALKESPQLWQTVQALRGEIVSRNKTMAKLADDLQEFDRKPDEDATYRELQVGREQIACTLDNVYQKIEEAYIAYKKMQATPGRNEFAEIMRSALEECTQEAETTAARYREMSKSK